jgi:MYXO-CTERM domain-containing protein
VALLTAATAAAFLLPGVARAAVVSNIAITTPTDNTNNIVGTLNGTTVVYSAANQNLLYTAATAGGTSILRYDTNPGDGLPGPADFLTETIKVDYAPGTVTNSSSMGLFTRVQGDGTGVLALLNAVSATSVQIRLFYGANTFTNAAGTAFFDSTFNLATGTATGGGTGSTNGIAASSPLTFTLTQTGAADPVFNLSVADAQGLVATTGNVTLTSAQSNLYDTAGSAALRVNGPAIGDTITIDNFSATPEPGALALIAFAALPALTRRRRAAGVCSAR